MVQQMNGLPHDTPGDIRYGTVTITSGLAVKYLTDDGTVTGNALLSSAVCAMAWINNSSNSYPCQASLSGDLKTLTVGANQQGTTSTNALINLLGAATAFITGVSYSSAPNSTVVNYLILGELA